MSNDFDVLYDGVSLCCGEAFHWEWNETDLRFEAECGCMKRYHLSPMTAEMEEDKEDFEGYYDE